MTDECRVDSPEWWAQFGVGRFDPETGLHEDYRLPEEARAELGDGARPVPLPPLSWPAAGQVVQRFSGGAVEFWPGTSIRRTYEVKASDYHGYNVHALVELRPDGRMGISALHVYSTESGDPVTGEGLRRLPLQTFVRRSFHPTSPVSGGVGHGLWLLSTADRDRMREAGPVTETLQMVAKLYTAAYVVGEPPTKTVAEAFEVPRPTAERWVRRARDRGLLGEALGPGRAGV